MNFVFDKSLEPSPPCLKPSPPMLYHLPSPITPLLMYPLLRLSLPVCDQGLKGTLDSRFALEEINTCNACLGSPSHVSN